MVASAETHDQKAELRGLRAAAQPPKSPAATKAPTPMRRSRREAAPTTAPSSNVVATMPTMVTVF